MSMISAVVETSLEVPEELAMVKNMRISVVIPDGHPLLKLGEDARPTLEEMLSLFLEIDSHPAEIAIDQLIYRRDLAFLELVERQDSNGVPGQALTDGQRLEAARAHMHRLATARRVLRETAQEEP